MTREDKIKAVEKMVINDIIGISAMENWGVKSLEGEGFLQTHEIARNRFRRLAERITDSIGVDESFLKYLEGNGNPYSEDFYTEPTSEEEQKANKVLEENGLSFTVFNFSMGNLARKTLIKEIREYLAQSPEIITIKEKE